VQVRGAGHFAVLDDANALQRFVCTQSEPPVRDASVRALSQGVLISLCEAVMRPGGADVLTLLRRRCGGADGGADASAWVPAGMAGQQHQQQQQQQQQQYHQQQPHGAQPPTWATQRRPPPAYLPPGPLPPPTLQPWEAGGALRGQLERAVGQLRYQCSVQQGALLDMTVRFKGFGADAPGGGRG
jgi:hypothetical protein